MTGMTMAAAMRRRSMMQRRPKAQIGIPQHRRVSDLGSPRVGVSGVMVWFLPRPDLGSGEGHREPLFSPVGVRTEGDGNAFSISEIDPVLDPRPDFSALLSRMFSMPIRLAVRPRSRFEASLVARRISSGRLVALPLASPACAASRFSGGGRFSSFPVTDGAPEVIGEAVPLESKAPAFSRPPRISVTLGSRGDVGVRGDRLPGDGVFLDRPFGTSLGVLGEELLAEEAERKVAPPPRPSETFCRSSKAPGWR